MNEYDIGDTVTLRATFTVSGTAADPTGIALAVTDPSGNVDNYSFGGGTVTRDSTGHYSKSIAVDEAGTWKAAWAGSGAIVATGTRLFRVRRAGT